jgi:hypothetical protein
MGLVSPNKPAAPGLMTGTYISDAEVPLGDVPLVRASLR